MIILVSGQKFDLFYFLKKKIAIFCQIKCHISSVKDSYSFFLLIILLLEDVHCQKVESKGRYVLLDVCLFLVF